MPSSEKAARYADFLRENGWGVTPPQEYRVDMEPPFLRIWESVREFTMTSLERGYALYKAVEYISRRNLPGDVVECGVWKGGSCMLVALALLQFGTPGTRIHLYDTFNGMTEPTEHDRIAWNGRRVLDKWKEDRNGRGSNFTAWSVGLEEVRRNILSTGFPEDRLVFMAGDVLETLKERVPESVSLLRLDTDWYESTAFELEILYPRLYSGGVLLIDDYGHFTGARKAVDDYFTESPQAIYLSRIDYTGRVGIKP